MKYLILSIVTVLLFSCSDQNDYEIGPGLKFNLQEDDKVMALSEEVVKNYEKIINYYDVQIPLSKYVKNNGDDLFFGLLYEAEVSDILLRFERDEQCSILKEESLEKEDYKISRFFISSKGNFFNRAIVEHNKFPFIYVVNLVSDDSSKIAKSYENKTILNNISD